MRHGDLIVLDSPIDRGWTCLTGDSVNRIFKVHGLRRQSITSQRTELRCEVETFIYLLVSQQPVSIFPAHHH